MATIVHFDISANDTKRAKTFYEGLFDWEIEQLPGPMNYYLIKTTGLNGEQGIGGGMATREAGRDKGILNYIGVASVASTLQKVTDLGGRILQPAQPVPGYGLLAVCADTEDNVFGIFEETQGE